MKISSNWLKQYLNISKSVEEISEILTNTGLEVEGLEKVQTVKGGLDGVVVGEVLTCEKHPDADKLSVTTVDIGSDEPVQIVCGAPNVDAGQKVPVATIGTTLYPGDKPFQIKKAKMRGQVSEGMICAEDELGLGSNHDGIMVLDNEARPGTPAKDYFNIEEDYVYEIGLTPNRTDAMSHIGVARDLKAALNFLEGQNLSLEMPSVKHFQVDNENLPVKVVIEDPKACPRYSGVTVSDVQVGESPDWLKNRLNAIGVRPINNLVDISNYVLFETGQPLHFFDADAIKGNTVRIKKLAQNTPFVTLDEVERKLSSEDLMICNDEEPMCIAGVFGGISSGVNQKTGNIFIESAYFDAPGIRKTSKRHGLQTDASFRFERGADPEITIYALKRAANLIKEIAGGKVSSQIVDEYPRTHKPAEVNISYENINKITGTRIPENSVKKILELLEFKLLKEEKASLTVEVPAYRADVTRPADVIEEILRIWGYNNIDFTEKITASLSYVDQPEPDRVRNIISDMLSSNSFYEIMNNSLTRAAYAERSDSFDEKRDVQILNPLSSELNAMRQSLLFGALESVTYNMNRQNHDLRLYEFGKVYAKDDSAPASDKDLAGYREKQQLALVITGKDHPESWHVQSGVTDFFTLKKYTVQVFERLGYDADFIQEEGISGEQFKEGLKLTTNGKTLATLGAVGDKWLRDFDIKQEVFFAEIYWDLVLDQIRKHKVVYEPVSRFPAVKRDLALLLNTFVTFAEIQNVAKKYGGKLLKSVNLFDVYQGENIEKGKKSYAVSFTLQNPEKTLKDKEIDKVMQKLIKGFEKETGAEIRK